MRNTLLFSFVLLAASVMAQQESHFTMFMYNTQWLNPGYVGSRNLASAQALYRHQWIGFDGAPVSQAISFNAPFFNKRVGFGLTAFHRTIGIMDQTSANLAYSYAIVNTNKLQLRAGLHGLVRQYRVDFTKVQDDVIIPTDPTMVANPKGMSFNVGAGLYANFGDKGYLGISVPSLLANDVGFEDGTLDTSATEFSHFYMMGGWMFPLNKSLQLKPAFMAKYVPDAPFDIDINLMLIYQMKLGAGLSYRLGGDDKSAGESIDFLLHYQINPKIGVGAAYDYTLSQLRNTNSGSIEIFMRVDINDEKVTMHNPRFFY